LEALHNQTYPPDRYEVIVVDNDSESSILPIIDRFGNARMEIETQPGSYAARNKGVSVARGEVFAFTDSDCRPANDWINKGVETLLSNPDCGLVAGRILLSYKNPHHLTSVEIYESIIAFQQKNYVEKHHYGATANIFTTKHIFSEIGLFNSTMRSGGDREWGNRVYSGGYQLVYADDVCISHPARRTFKQLYNKSTRVTLGVDNKNAFALSKIYIRMLFKPPIEQIGKGWNSDQLNFSQKLKFFFVVIFVKYAMAWQTTRLLFGAEPKR
jgi:glycosyltransferase involved in cell wall biosynthesis